MSGLNVFEIRRKTQFFDWYVDPCDCAYHIEKSDGSLKIYAEYNIACEAQYLYLFELIKKSKCFVLKFFSESDVDADPIEGDNEEVIQFVIEKIIKETTLGEDWVEKKIRDGKENVRIHLEQMDELKKVLEEKIREFIV